MRGTIVPLLALALLSATCSRGTESDGPPPLIPMDKVAAPSGLGQRAYEHVTNLVAMGPRFTGSPGWSQAIDYIAQTLQLSTGIAPVRDRWTDEKFGVTFENVTLTIPGKSPHRIVLGCHHDTKKCEGHPDPKHNFHFVGANDSGSGVGLLLALAEELARAPREATIQLVFFDGEECLEYDWDDDKALFGSRRFVAEDRARQLAPGNQGKTRALVLLDMVGRRGLQIDHETNSTPELTHIFRSAAHAAGHADHFFNKSMAIKDDHLPFLQAGIPAIDLIDLIDNPQWHTPDDTLAHISAQSLHLVGEVVLTALPAVEAHYFPPPGKLDLPGGR